MDIMEIQKILPHRYPFLLVDRVEEIEPGKKAVGYKNVTINENFFQGHFPQEPVMPGVLQVEALAQLGAIAMLSLEENKGKIGFLGSIKNAKFRRKVVPGDVLKLEVELIKVKGPAGIGKGIATVNGEKACEVELTFMLSK